MESASADRTTSAHGRVVMLVDNGVQGDSRVQKAARSAADAGWDVVLVGISPRDDLTETYQLGGAEVVLVPVPPVLRRRRDEFRRSWLWPLAYPPNGIAPHRQAWAKARHVDLRMRMALRASNGQSGFRTWVASLSQRGQLLAARVMSRWVSLRYSMLTRRRRGRTLHSPWDRAYAAFWRAVKGDRSWRRLYPGLWDYELAMGKVIDTLQPDIIHANDFCMLGVGARAVVRARQNGREVSLVWDAHEFLPGLPEKTNPRWLPAHCAYEREYAPYADAVVAVSDALADLLTETHRLAARPAVVLNAPVSAPEPGGQDTAPLDLRSLCGVERTTPLIAYCGNATAMRGVDVLVEALPALPGVHLAMVSLPPGRPLSKYVQGLLDRGEELGVAERIHLLPFVAHWQVPGFLATADLAVSPLLHIANHEIALSNKFFEYSQARLPLVVSDVKTMAETVRSTGQGEVFRAGDAADYVRAVQAVLADPLRYRAAYDKPDLLENWTWEAQAKILDDVYHRLSPARAGEAAHVPVPSMGNPAEAQTSVAM